ncbi:MAG: Ig-like domain repeat protein, partial [Thermoplasmata archaeon]|nr:Ig-like domain repeat protein [Thermoplasmata archaeon]
MFDNKPPEQSFIINNNAKFTNSLDVNLTLESEDSGSGVALMTFSNDGQKWFTWEPIDDYKLFNVSIGDGVKELYFKVQDRAGNIAEPVTNSIILDTKPPECSIIINEDALYTKSYGVSVDLNATDELSGVDMMAFSFDHEKWTIWRPFKPDEKLTLPSTDGKKTVYFRVRDKAGNIGEVNDTIILDTIPPQSLSIEINNGASETGSKKVILNLHAIDKTSGLDQMSFSIKSTVWSDWEDYSNSTTFNLTAGSGEITIYFRVKDKAGNIANPTIDTIIFNEPVQPKKTNQEQLDYWYLIIIIIIIIIFTILAVVFKRKKKVPHKVLLVPAVTIKPKELTAPPMTVAKISAAPKITQLPVSGTHLTSNLQQQPITQVTTSQPLPRLPPAFQSKPQSPVSITPTIAQTPSITPVSKVPIPGEQ